MKRIYLILFAAVALMASCEKTTEKEVLEKGMLEQSIPENDLKVFKQMGYDTRSIEAIEGGYIINGTTTMTRSQLEEARASYIWFQIKTDINDPLLVDLNQNHVIYVEFDSADSPSWLACEATATLYNEDTHTFIPLTYLGEGKWSFKLSGPGTYLATVTIKDPAHSATTEEKHIIVQPGCQPFFYNVERDLITQTSYERSTIRFFKDQACTQPYNVINDVECNYTVWTKRTYFSGKIDTTAYLTKTVIIPSGKQSFELYSGPFLTTWMDWDDIRYATVNNINYIY